MVLETTTTRKEACLIHLYMQNVVFFFCLWTWQGLTFSCHALGSHKKIITRYMFYSMYSIVYTKANWKPILTVIHECLWIRSFGKLFEFEFFIEVKYLQLNEYKTVPYFLQSSQNLTLAGAHCVHCTVMRFLDLTETSTDMAADWIF